MLLIHAHRSRATPRSGLLILSLLLSAVLTGCGDSPEHKTYQASLALRNGVPKRALELLEEVLRKRPGDLEATLLKAQAQMQLAELDGAKTTLNELAKAAPEEVRVHRMSALWSYERMRSLLLKTDFAANGDLQRQFDEAMSVGMSESDWLQNKGKDAPEADYRRGSLALLDAARFGRLAAAVRAKQRDTGTDAGFVAQEFDRKRESRETDGEGYLWSSVRGRAEHERAGLELAGLLRSRSKWEGLWELSELMAGREKLSSRLVEQLVVSLLVMPEEVRGGPERVALGWRLTGQVGEKQRSEGSWQLTAARLHLTGREPGKAEPMLEELVRAQPGNREARYAWGLSLYQLKKHERAREVLSKLSTESKSPAVLSLYGRVLMALGDDVQAREHLKEALDLNPSDAGTMQAWVELMARNKGSGGGEVEELLRQNPSDPRAIGMMLQYLRYQGDKEGVEKQLARVGGLKPLGEEHVRLLVEGWSYLGRWGEVERWSRELVRRRGEDASSHMALATALMMQDKREEALGKVREVRERFPQESGRGRVLEARLWGRRGLWDKAVDLLEGHLKESPRDREGLLLLAQALAGQGRLGESLERVGQLLEEDPGSVEGHALAVRVYQLTGERGKVDEHLHQIEEGQIDERQQPHLLAQVKLRKGDLEGAAEVCQRALAGGSTDVSLRYLLAQVYLEQGKGDQAEGVLLELVQRDPSDASSFGALTRFYGSRKEWDKGLASLSRLQSGAGEVNARLGQSALLLQAGRVEESAKVLEAVYGNLVSSRHAQAMSVADGLARAYAAKGDLSRAGEVYQRMIDADLRSWEAQLRRIDLEGRSWGREKTLSRLDALSSGSSGGPRELRLGLIQRYQRLGRSDRGLGLLEPWLKEEGGNWALWRLKGELEGSSGDWKGALASFERAVGLDPQNAGLRLSIGRVHEQNHDPASAEGVYRGMLGLDGGARVHGWTRLGQMYLRLGLNEEARRAFEELEKLGRPKDPRVIFAAGQAYQALGENVKAMERYGKIAPYAPQYAAAQLAMARAQLRSNQSDEAKKIVKQLLKDERHGAGALSLLVQMDPRNLHALIGDAVRVDALPPAARLRFLASDAVTHADAGAWDKLAAVMDRMHATQPESIDFAVGRVVAWTLAGKPEAAKAAWNKEAKAAASPEGRLVAALLGEAAPAGDPQDPFAGVIEHLLRGQSDQARALAAKAAVRGVLHPRDLIALAGRADLSAGKPQAALRELAWAYAALSTQQPQVADAFAQRALAADGSIALAHAVRIGVALERDRELEAMVAAADQAVGTSAAAGYGRLQLQWRRRDFAGAQATIGTLLADAPSADELRVNLAQAQRRQGKVKEAIAIYRELWSGKGGFRLATGNELASALADGGPGEVQEAQRIALEVHEGLKGVPEAQDTLGWAEHRLGKSQEGLKRVVAALDAKPDLQEVHYHAGAIHAALGNREWARRHLERSLAGAPDGTPDGAFVEAAAAALKALAN